MPVTLDGDFANILRFPPGGAPGVIRPTVHAATEGAIRQQIERALRLLRTTPLDGCPAVSHGDIVRVRRGTAGC
ncbi:MAG: hypothetical protein IPM24_17815 [Bryobacterales bacterium]|nr:hypothetical protein [Bryobacterales bacterium]